MKPSDQANATAMHTGKWSYLGKNLALLVMLAVTTVVNVFLQQFIQPSSLVFVYLINTIAGAIYFGTWAAVFSFVGGFLIFNFFFVEPYYSLHIADPQDIYNITLYFVMAGVMTYLIRIIRRQNEALKDRLDRTALIEDMSMDYLDLAPLKEPFADTKIPEYVRRDLLNQLGKITMRYATMIMNSSAVVFFPQEDGTLKIWGRSSLDLEVSAEEQTAADWTYRSGEISGAGALNHSESSFFFLPLKSHEYVIGVLGIRTDFKDLFPEQRRILGAISNLTSLVAARWVDLKFEQG